MGLHHRLAVHETMMIQELLLGKSLNLWKYKRALHEIHDEQLKELIAEQIPIEKEDMWDLVTLLQRRPLLLPSDYISKGSEYGK